MMRRVQMLAIAAVVTFMLINCSKNKGKEMGKGKDSNPLPVMGIVVSPQEFENKIEVVGTILPNEKVDLKSEISGRVTGIYFKEGSKVSKGSLLVKIYDNDLKAQLKKVKIQQSYANLEEERKKKLLDISGISQQEYDLAKNQADALNADAELLEAQLRKTEILAPFNGTIGLRNISEGEIVSSSTLVASLQQVDPIKVEFDIPEKYSYYMNKGSALDFNVNDSEDLYKGIVYATEPMIDVNTRTLKVRAHCSNKDQKLKPGSFVKIQVVLQKRANTIMVPSECVIPGMKEQKVYVCNNGMAFSKKIKTGARTDKQIEVLEGLSLNDTIVASGIMQMKDSVKINLRLK